MSSSAARGDRRGWTTPRLGPHVVWGGGQPMSGEDGTCVLFSVTPSQPSPDCRSSPGAHCPSHGRAAHRCARDPRECAHKHRGWRRWGGDRPQPHTHARVRIAPKRCNVTPPNGDGRISLSEGEAREWQSCDDHCAACVVREIPAKLRY